MVTGQRLAFIAVVLTVAAASIGARQDAPPLPVAATLTGTARAVDGDTIAFGRVRVRLQGIAAPELDEPGGPAAAQAMAAMIDGLPLRCDLDGTTGAGRPVAVCYLNGQDIGREMVAQGLARDCPRFSANRYQDSEQAARTNARDLSQGYPLPNYCTP